jgi:hypothetical protein
MLRHLTTLTRFGLSHDLGRSFFVQGEYLERQRAAFLKVRAAALSWRLRWSVLTTKALIAFFGH